MPLADDEPDPARTSAPINPTEDVVEFKRRMTQIRKNKVSARAKKGLPKPIPLSAAPFVPPVLPSDDPVGDLGREVRELRLTVVSLLAKRDPKLATTCVSQGQTDLPAIVWHGGKSYSVGDSRMVVVPHGVDLVFQAFLRHPRAMEAGELEEVAGVTNVPGILSAFVKRFDLFKPAVHRPGKKGLGGYVARVVKSED